jgi:hypothetical protein
LPGNSGVSRSPLAKPLSSGLNMAAVIGFDIAAGERPSRGEAMAGRLDQDIGAVIV